MKLLFNMTINIDHDAHDRWISWMTRQHIPAIMNTRCFESWKISRVLGADESTGVNYAIQFVVPSAEKFNEFRENQMSKLQEVHSQEFGNKYVSFMTLLQTVDEGIFEGIND